MAYDTEIATVPMELHLDFGSEQRNRIGTKASKHGDMVPTSAFKL